MTSSAAGRFLFVVGITFRHGLLSRSSIDHERYLILDRAVDYSCIVRVADRRSWIGGIERPYTYTPPCLSGGQAQAVICIVPGSALMPRGLLSASRDVVRSVAR